MPIIDKLTEINNNVFNFKLLEGFSAETSGGIMCMISKDKVKDFRNELLEKYGQESWIIGDIVKGNK